MPGVDLSLWPLSSHVDGCNAKFSCFLLELEKTQRWKFPVTEGSGSIIFKAFSLELEAFHKSERETSEVWVT